MARQIIKQPNGKYCIFSSIVDNITDYNLSEQEIIDLWTEESRQEIVKKVKIIMAALNNNGNPYYQFTQNFDQVLETIKRTHGIKEAKRVKKIIEK